MFVYCFLTILSVHIDTQRQHHARILKLEQAIESLTIMRDVVRRCCAEPYNRRSPRGNLTIVLVRIEEKLVLKKEEWERLKGIENNRANYQ